MPTKTLLVGRQYIGGVRRLHKGSQYQELDAAYEMKRVLFEKSNNSAKKKCWQELCEEETLISESDYIKRS